MALQLQLNVSQLMAIDKDALEFGDGEHASHARTCCLRCGERVLAQEHLLDVGSRCFIVFAYARAKIRCCRFFNLDLRKKLCFIKADWVG